MEKTKEQIEQYAQGNVVQEIAIAIAKESVIKDKTNFRETPSLTSFPINEVGQFTITITGIIDARVKIGNHESLESIPVHEQKVLIERTDEQENYYRFVSLLNE